MVRQTAQGLSLKNGDMRGVKYLVYHKWNKIYSAFNINARVEFLGNKMCDNEKKTLTVLLWPCLKAFL